MSELRTPDELTAKTCPDCGFEYMGHPDDNCCADCFDKFNGMTIEEICGG